MVCRAGAGFRVRARFEVRGSLSHPRHTWAVVAGECPLSAKMRPRTMAPRVTGRARNEGGRVSVKVLTRVGQG